MELDPNTSDLLETTMSFDRNTDLVVFDMYVVGEDSVVAELLINIVDNIKKNSIMEYKFYIENNDIYLYYDFTNNTYYENTEFATFKGFRKRYSIRSINSGEMVLDVYSYMIDDYGKVFEEIDMTELILTKKD